MRYLPWIILAVVVGGAVLIFTGNWAPSAVFSNAAGSKVVSINGVKYVVFANGSKIKYNAAQHEKYYAG